MCGAPSRHPGGVNVTLCEGSERYVSDVIDLLVWQAVSHYQGREAVQTAC
jgi:hypothetical protein